MAVLFLLLLSLPLTPVQSFLAPLSFPRSCVGRSPTYLRKHDTVGLHEGSVEQQSTYPAGDELVAINESLCADATLNQRNDDRLGLDSVEQSTYPGDDAPLVAINESRRVDATALAESKKPASAYQITRPRWYNKSEVAIIVLLCQRLRIIDLKGVEHMLDAQKAFSKQNPVSLFLCLRMRLDFRRLSTPLLYLFATNVYKTAACSCKQLTETLHSCRQQQVELMMQHQQQKEQ